MMCCGKSTVGRLLAPRLGLPFIDLDREIEARVGPLLPFVQRSGEEAFRAVESEVLAALADAPDSVIATGGGTPTVPGNLALLRSIGTMVWIDVALETLMPRIERAGGDRPLLFGLKGDALRERVMDLLDQRALAYSQAPVRVRGEGAAEEVVARIEAALLAQRK
ncbi:MAG: shikimate kinase [Flavobacteriales bacterium]|jgi:shikimate kinase|nr:shikimate kinase [Flavobacteriales bacterium]